jgi:hypothetical protein
MAAPKNPNTAEANRKRREQGDATAARRLVAAGYLVVRPEKRNEELVTAVAKRLEPTSTYVDVDTDVVDGLLSQVVEAVLAELDSSSGEAWPLREETT